MFAIFPLKFIKKIDEMLLNVLRLERCKRMHSLQISKNAENKYVLAKIGVETAENEPDVDL